MKKIFMFVALFSFVPFAFAAKAWYMAPIIGTGSRTDAFRVDIGTYPAGTTYAALIPTLPSGVPAFNFGLAIVSSPDAAPFTNPNNLNEITIAQMDLSTSSLPSPKITKITNFLVNHSMPTTILTSTSTLRGVIRGVGLFVDPNFDETILNAN